VLYRPRSGQGWEEESLGLMADPAPKGDEGKIACQETKGHAQAYGVVLWGTRVISVNDWIV